MDFETQESSVVKPVEYRNFFTIFTKGNIFSKLSYLIFGLANIHYGQVIKGLIFLLAELVYIFFMVTAGAGQIAQLSTLGTHTRLLRAPPPLRWQQPVPPGWPRELQH